MNFQEIPVFLLLILSASVSPQIDKNWKILMYGFDLRENAGAWLYKYSELFLPYYWDNNFIEVPERRKSQTRVCCVIIIIEWSNLRVIINYACEGVLVGLGPSLLFVQI